MTEEELEKKAKEYSQWLYHSKAWNPREDMLVKAYLAGAKEMQKENAICERIIIGEQMEIDGLQKENKQLKDLLEKYRESVRKCLHITFMGAGCDVNSIAQYSYLVDKYLTEVEGLTFWKN